MACSHAIPIKSSFHAKYRTSDLRKRAPENIPADVIVYGVMPGYLIHLSRKFIQDHGVGKSKWGKKPEPEPVKKKGKKKKNNGSSSGKNGGKKGKKGKKGKTVKETTPPSTGLAKIREAVFGKPVTKGSSVKRVSSTGKGKGPVRRVFSTGTGTGTTGRGRHAKLAPSLVDRLKEFTERVRP